MRPVFATVLALCALLFGACGGNKDVDTATYTCGQFQKSLQTKDDNTSGNYINGLRKQAKLGQKDTVERSEITLGIIVACRDKPASTKPAAAAIATAKKIKAGTFKLPKQKKKSSK
jgi:hypothetical protein